KSWLGVDASGIGLSLAVDPLTVSLSNVGCRWIGGGGPGGRSPAGRISSRGAGFCLPPPGLPTPPSLMWAARGPVALPGVFKATGTGSLDQGQVSGTDSTTSQTLTDAQAVALTLDTSAAGGVGSAAASLRLVSLTQRTSSWLGVDASGINLSLTVDPLSL